MSAAPRARGVATRDASIVATDVRRSFGSGANTNEVLRGVSIEIRPGELTLIVGPSGSGKSTLLSVLSGLLRPGSGHVSVLGETLWDLDEEAIDAFRLRHCGFVFQGFNLFPALTALEQVVLPLQYGGVRGPEAMRRAIDALESVGLGARLDLRPQELSGGEKQRVAIARALAKEPELVFADEPTSALDRDNGRIVIELLHRAATQRGATVLAVTHDPRLVAHADRVLRIEDGGITADEVPDAGIERREAAREVRA
ncbi:sulfonate transport system ATP-binding protein [Myxococcaceae bacterium]|jgi:putative ABC transport system ATP-binding protein|nr:sulfonate transport system ATP-binding protein [Myxococcaceae bacterium]